jgi:protein gp37
MGTIAWTDKSIGGATLGLYGCSHAGEGCASCWAESMASRFEAHHGYPPGIVEGGRWTGKVVADVEQLYAGFKAKVPGPRSKVQRVFPWSTADLLHDEVPFEYIMHAVALMASKPWIQFQILTKRTERAAGIVWPPNVQIIASCSTQADINRMVTDLLSVLAAVRGLSLEPLIDEVDLDLRCHGIEIDDGEYSGGRVGDYLAGPVDDCPMCHDTGRVIDWVIVGAESGPRRRPCRTEWVRSVVEQCADAGVACFVKQVHLRTDSAGRDVTDLPGLWDESDRYIVSHDPSDWPADLRVREFPEEP